MVIGIDPAPLKSAYVLWDGKNILVMDIRDNEDIIQEVFPFVLDNSPDTDMAIETVVNMGMPAAGKSLFDTSRWVGHFERAWKIAGGIYHEVTRGEVKMHFCNSMRAKDPNIRQSLIDRFEPDLLPKKRPKGILKGVSKDCWSALAVAVYYWDRKYEVNDEQG